MNYISKSSTEERELLERFLRYTKTWSESSSSQAEKGIMPSTPQQQEFADSLAAEMRRIGMEWVRITQFCYAYGYISASKGCEKIPPFCMVAHLDTVDEVTGWNVQPVIHAQYDGKQINLANNIVLDSSKDSYLAQAASEHDTIITSDGTTLLGADDKAGIAEILTAIEYLVKHPELKHGKIEVILSPDEETGHGMDHVPSDLVTSRRAYTVDGGHAGEIETECFNAYGTSVEFTGKAAHTGDARAHCMVNAISTACAFVNSLPANQRPETTDGREGFFAPMEITGTIEKAQVSLLLRDFTEDGMKKRKALVEQLASSAAASFGAEVKVTHKQQYLNMKQNLDKHPSVVQDLEKAYRESGLTPVYKPIRGGTDGSRLTEMGIPTPNIFTGGHNYHSRSEWASLNQMRAAADVIINLAVITAAQA